MALLCRRLIAPLVNLFLFVAIPVRAQVPTFLGQWGSEGTGPGQFLSPSGIAIGPTGDVYVTDTINQRVQRFTASGGFLQQWGNAGTGPGQFSYPFGIAVDDSGNVFVAEAGNRLQKFTASGVFVKQWNAGGPVLFIAFDHGRQQVHVTDTQFGFVRSFNTSGQQIVGWGGDGFTDGRFHIPSGIAVQANGQIVVADFSARIQRFDPAGFFLGKWGSFGTESGQFNLPYGLACDPNGNVYVTDVNNNRVQKFNATGTFLGQWGGLGSGPGQFQSPYGVAADGFGNVYVVDHDQNRIQKFGPLPVAARSTTWGRLKQLYR